MWHVVARFMDPDPQDARLFEGSSSGMIVSFPIGCTGNFGRTKLFSNPKETKFYNLK
jgi:hypothetical protein